MDALAALQFGLAPALARALLHALWQDAILGIAAWATLAMMTRSTAALRHSVAMGFLLAMVLVPASTFAHFWQVPGASINVGPLSAMTAPRLDGTAMFEQQTSPMAILLALLWLTGVAAMLLRHLGGWWIVSALDKHAFERLPADWQRRVDALCAAMRIGRDVTVRLSTSVIGPFTARLFRPVIWLPLSLITQLPREQVEALLAHELAHIARMDWLWNGLQCLVESLLFFHPAAWWLGRRIRTEREHACDDRAVAACGDAIALAEALAGLECQRQSAPRLVLAAHGGALMQRITRLVSGPPSRGRWGAGAAIALVLVAGTLLAVQAGIAGRPGLHVRSTTDGVLGPGDTREITARGIEGDRYYRADVDANGHLTEVYKLDDQPRPIDAGVRRWLAEIERLSVPPAPPPLPPLPPPPLPPPPPPPPPKFTDTAAFHALFRRVAAAPVVVARVGTPVAMASDEVQGHIEIQGSDVKSQDGVADIRFDVSGPKGRATVLVDAQLDAGAWSIETVKLANPR